MPTAQRQPSCTPRPEERRGPQPLHAIALESTRDSTTRRENYRATPLHTRPPRARSCRRRLWRQSSSTTPCFRRRRRRRARAPCPRLRRAASPATRGFFAVTRARRDVVARPFCHRRDANRGGRRRIRFTSSSSSSPPSFRPFFFFSLASGLPGRRRRGPSGA